MLQLISGLLASSVHVVTGPDHLAAVTPIAIESKKKAWVIGVFWGFGHILGMLLIGLLFFLFRDLVNVEKISGYSEQLVGFILIFIGTWALLKVFWTGKQKHKHPHFHQAPEPHVHIHTHDHHDEFDHKHKHDKVVKQGKLSALSIGTLHGFAGISHFLLVLPTLALPTRLEAASYLIGFAAGTILAMGGYAFILGIISSRSSAVKSKMVFNTLRMVGGILAIGVGIWWLFESGAL
jgi:ABC-type nickel/cobalt efflux system permease component RcnA